MNEMYENWVNGNRKDVVEALIKGGKGGKLSEAIEFAAMLSKDDRPILLKMLRNRDS